MMRHIATVLVLSAITLGLGACASGPKTRSVHPATVQPIGNDQELGDAIALLDQGDEKGARKKLEAMIKRDPADRRPQQLLESLSADPVASLGAHAFDYRVAPGDTLQDLAQRFLGDRFKFYLLARYNGVAVPAQLKTGQLLRIPGDAPKVAPQPARTRSDAGASAPSSKGPATKPTPDTPRASADNPRRAVQLRASGLAALTKGQVGQAVGLLQQALALDPSNSLIQRDLTRARRLQETVKARR